MLADDIKQAIINEKRSSYVSGQRDLAKSFQDVLERFGDISWKTSEVISMINDVINQVKE